MAKKKTDMEKGMENKAGKSALSLIPCQQYKPATTHFTCSCFDLGTVTEMQNVDRIWEGSQHTI
jgi:hypothetical protein